MANYDAFAEFRMDGHSVIITGGAQNIGAGIAKTLSGAGARVMIADLNGDMAAETAAEIAADYRQRLSRNGLRCHRPSRD